MIMLLHIKRKKKCRFMKMAHFIMEILHYIPMLYDAQCTYVVVDGFKCRAAFQGHGIFI